SSDANHRPDGEEYRLVELRHGKILRLMSTIGSSVSDHHVWRASERRPFSYRQRRGRMDRDNVASANGWRDSAAGRLELSIASPRCARITESVGRPDRPGRSTEHSFGADGSL